MADFNFIVVPELRQGLQSDYKELRACLNAEAWKAVHVLAGSIVEAVLIDALGNAGVDHEGLERETLAKLIDLAKCKQILDAETVDLSTVIRQYRNLIHPGKITRLAKSVDRSGAIVAAEVVEIVARQVAKRKQETYGYTAEQVLDKLNGGSSALSLVDRVVKATQKPEIERLLIDLLPESYFAATGGQDAELAYKERLLVCYRSIFNLAPEDVRRRVCKRLYKVYRDEPDAIVNLYEDKFFTASDLAYLADDERGWIKDHFLARLDHGELTDERMSCLEGIGPFLTAPAEARIVAVALLSACEGELGHALIAQIILFNEYPKMNDACRSEVRAYAQEISPATQAKLEKLEAQIRFAANGEASGAVN